MNVPAEVAQQIGDNRVRAIAMKPTDGLVRGAPVVNTGHGVQAPVGDGTLGHIWNVMGDCLDAPDHRTDDRHHQLHVVAGFVRRDPTVRGPEPEAVEQLVGDDEADADHREAIDADRRDDGAEQSQCSGPR